MPSVNAPSGPCVHTFLQKEVQAVLLGSEGIVILGGHHHAASQSVVPVYRPSSCSTFSHYLVCQTFLLTMEHDTLCSTGKVTGARCY